jgi:ubiquinone/menaquinone biosynthesis C-methylase UbiE
VAYKNFVTALHQSTKRDYLARMMDSKVECMGVAKEYEGQYWDGDRRFGYGGYRYMPGRWKPVAEALIHDYGLKSGSKVLDVGCGKGFLLHEMKLLEPGLEIKGFDISEHGLNDAKEEVKTSLFKHRAEDPFPFEDSSFDLVISLGTLHNLRVFELESSLQEIERVGKAGYLMVESYRNNQELFNLQCWALTAETFLDHKEWPWLLKKFGYSGDYEFIFFE